MAAASEDQAGGSLNNRPPSLHGERTASLDPVVTETLSTPLAAGTATEPFHTPPSSAAELPLPEIPGYAIVRELGRGGMGIVYEALQARPQRRVAIKMILAGSRATESDRVRFLRETNAIARLNHENIVQIFEVDQQGIYCTLEFVDGGSLADVLRSKPDRRLPPNEAAGLVEILARAMHVAHVNGIIHRDLKPGNILMTSEGRLKISDFGLAKRLDEDDDQTQTNQILGTRLYMAPEQAAGHSKDVGPAADLYALGAILYQLLTGRPPHTSDTPAKLMNKILHEDPVPPRRIALHVPRDLQNVCLKCLNKRATERYGSASELADDLRRFLNHEPVVARRLSRVTRGLRWARRRPIDASLAILGLGFVLVVLLGSYWYRGTVRDRRMAELQASILKEVERDDWSSTHLGQIDMLIAELAAAEPSQAREAEQIVNRRLGQSIEKLLRISRSIGRDREQIELAVAALAARDSDAAARLNPAVQARLGVRRTVAELAAPFSNTRDLFGQIDVRLEPAGVVRVKPEGHPLPLADVRTTVPSAADIDVEVEFDASWRSGAQVGVVLEGAGQQKYTFSLGWGVSQLGAGPNLLALRSDLEITEARVVHLDIRRDDEVLQSDQLPMRSLNDGSLRLAVQRRGAHLRMEVSGQQTVEFEDLFAIPESPQANVALIWPADVGIKRFAVTESAVPPAPNPIEEADALHAAGRFDEALKLYQEYEIGVTTAAGEQSSLLREAKLKRALCLLQLNHNDPSALELLKGLSADSLRAACYLWHAQAVLGNFAGADEMLGALLDLESANVPLRVPVHLPVKVRSEIQKLYQVSTSGLNALAADQDMVYRLTQLVEAERVLGITTVYRGWNQQALARALAAAGKHAFARDKVLRWLETEDYTDTPFAILLAREYGWLMRQAGDPEPAMNVIKRQLASPERMGVYAKASDSLLIDLGRCQMALADLSESGEDQSRLTREATANLQRYIQSKGEDQTEYRTYSDACLLLGLLHDQAGEAVLAREYWRRGKFRGSLKSPDAIGRLAGNIGAINHLICGALCDDLPREEITDLIVLVVNRQLNAAERLVVQAAFEIVPLDAFRTMWQTRRGKQSALIMAQQCVSFPDYWRKPLVQYNYEVARLDAFGGELTPEQDEVVWELSNQVIRRGLDDRFVLQQGLRQHLMNVLFLWRGLGSPAAWQSLAADLEPSARAGVAYVLGHRYRRLGKPEQSAKFFQLARENCVPDSALQELLKHEQGISGNPTSVP